MGKEIAIDSYPFLHSYVVHTKSWRERVSDLWDIPTKTAKKVIVALNHNGLPRVEEPLLWALARDFKRAADVLLTSTRFSRFGRAVCDSQESDRDADPFCAR